MSGFWRGFTFLAISAITALAQPPEWAGAQPKSNFDVVHITTDDSLDTPFPFKFHSVTTGPPELADPRRRFKPDTLLVKPKKNVPVGQLNAGHAAINAKVERTLPAIGNLQIIRLPRGLSVEKAIEHYRRKGLVEYAEPDYEVHALLTPNDPKFLDGSLWGLNKISAPAAWDLRTSAEPIIAAVVDTGVWAGHPDLVGNIWINPTNGTHGFSFINNVESTNPDDDHGHGTHVAGTIGAVGNNAIGVVGVNWTIKIAGFKFLQSGGSGSISDAILCYDKIIALKQQGVNIRVVNNSWGGGGFSQGFSDATGAASALGIVSVFAAGNNGANIDTAPFYPAAMTNQNIISVLASDSNDLKAGFSNYGYANSDIAAPGVTILSTLPPGPCALCQTSTYGNLNGTSMAAPHVAGAVAALLAERPGLTPNQVRDVLLHPGSYDLVSTSAGQTSSGGRLNLYKLLTNPYADNPVPNNPPTLQQSAHEIVVGPGGIVNVTFSASDPDGDTTRSGAGSSVGGLSLDQQMASQLIPLSFTDTLNFTAPSFRVPAVMNYVTYANDFKGGSAVSNVAVQINRHLGLVNSPPLVTLTVDPTQPGNPTNYIYRLNWSGNDSDSPGVVRYSYSMGTWIGCCFNGTVTMNLNNLVGRRLRARTYTMDTHLNLTENEYLFDVGTVTNGEPPTVEVVLDRTIGPAPLTVNIDLTGSTDPDSTSLKWSGVVFYDPSQKTPSWGPYNPSVLTGSLTLPGPGQYAAWFQVNDEQGNSDSRWVYLTALQTIEYPTEGLLTVSPTSGLSALGPPGGPFSPSSRNYTLSNTGGQSITWAASKSAAWVSLSPSSGSLAPGASTTVAVSINSSANSLTSGIYTDTVTFTNTTNGEGSTERSVVLTVNVPPFVSSAQIVPSPDAFSDEPLTLANVVVTDADSDPVTLAYQWQFTTNGVAYVNQAGATTDTLPAAPANSGKLWRCRITPSDFAGAGTNFFTAAVAVNNRPNTLSRHGQFYSYDSDLFLAGGTPFTRDALINEFSQGPSGGTAEWVEILLLRNSDARGWKLYDSNSGTVTFSSATLWSNMTAGTLLVIYNGSTTKDPVLPADDTDPSDGTLVIPHNNATYFSGSWIGLANTGDSIILSNANDSVLIDGISYSTGSGQIPVIPNVGSGQSACYTNNTEAGVDLAANWRNISASLATPTAGNSTANSQFVADLRSGAFGQPQFRFAATSDLVPGLSIDPATGLISGTINAPSGGFYNLVIERYLMSTVVSQQYTLLVGNSSGVYTIPATKTWLMNANLTIAGSLNVSGTLDTGGRTLVVSNTLNVASGTVNNASGLIRYHKLVGGPLPGASEQFNSLPVISSASISPARPKIEENLVATVTSAIDGDGDPISFAFQWQQSADNVSFGDIAFTSNTMSSPSLTAGNYYRVRITPDDGIASGAPFTTASVRPILMQITGLQMDGADVLVSFVSFVGETYEVQRTDSMPPGSWTTVATGVAGTGGTVTVTNSGAASLSQVIYRVKRLP